MDMHFAWKYRSFFWQMLGTCMTFLGWKRKSICKTLNFAGPPFVGWIPQTVIGYPNYFPNNPWIIGEVPQSYSPIVPIIFPIVNNIPNSSNSIPNSSNNIPNSSNNIPIISQIIMDNSSPIIFQKTSASSLQLLCQLRRHGEVQRIRLAPRHRPRRHHQHHGVAGVPGDVLGEVAPHVLHLGVLGVGCWLMTESAGTAQGVDVALP